MSFLNKYKKEDHIYRNSVIVGNAVYTIGNTIFLDDIWQPFAYGLITKTDTNGNVIWEKKYISSDHSVEKFDLIVKCENDDIIILFSITSDENYGLYRINSAGEVLWKTVFTSTETNSRVLFSHLLKLTGENYLVHFTEEVSDSENEVTGIYDNFVKIDGNGVVLLEKRIADFNVHDIAVDNTKIVVVGHFTNCIVLDYNFNQTNKFGLRSVDNSTGDVYLYQVLLHNDQIILNCQTDVDRTSFIAKLDIPNNPTTGSFTGILLPGPGLLTQNSSNLFYTYSDFENARPNIVKINYNLELQGIKQYNTSDYISINQTTEDHHLFTVNTVNGPVGYLNLDFDSCKTSTIPLVDVTLKQLFFNSDFTAPLIESNIAVANKDFVITNITSEIEEVCPVINPNVSITRNDTVIIPGQLTKEENVLNLGVGSIELTNNGETVVKLVAGTVIALENGITFSLQNATTVNPNSTTISFVIANGSPIESGNFSKLISITNVSNPNQFVINFSVKDQISGCDNFVAIVVDESGSISQNEAQQIRAALTSFIDSQISSNTTLSLIGMSNNDVTTRQDNVIEKRISNNRQDFLNWINAYGTRSVDAQSDHWASGLQAVKNLQTTPDIIFVVTDGLQVNNTSTLKNLYSTLNQKSHIFVYGVTGNSDDLTIEKELVAPLGFYLGKAPVLRTESNTLLEADYRALSDFSLLDFELNQLATDLKNAQLGCFSNVIVNNENLAYPILKKGVSVHQEAGTLTLKNRGRLDITLAAGTRIHNTSTINGLIFTLRDNVTIAGRSEVNVVIKIDGTPKLTGSFNKVISLNNVDNPLLYNIVFNVIIEKYTVDVSPEKTALQSSHLQLIAAGSKGIDSTEGIHLRWLFGGLLGENHLPKGDSYTGDNAKFNKTNDFVNVYRAPYNKVSFALDLTLAPQVVDNSNSRWIYKLANGADTRVFYVNFNKERYRLTKLNFNPQTNPVGFIQAYGNYIIEIENKSELFFAAELNFGSLNNSSILRLETISLAESTKSSSKIVSTRKTYTSSDLNTLRVVAENGRSIRFKANNCTLNTISFEFYSDFIKKSNDNGSWDLKGKYALSLDDNKVFTQLEPKLNAVHGKWLKYNDGEYVNIKNYKTKWQRDTVDGDKNIKQVVASYISLSEHTNNQKAEETVELGQSATNEPKEGEEQEFVKNTISISNLDLLNIAANDYHIARMLGLGCIDVDDTVLSGEFVYLTEYTTFGDLESDTDTLKEVQHISMSIPTSVNTERLPLPIQLSKIEPGLNVDDEGNEPAKITDKDGYSFDGKKRYVSLFMEDIMDYDSVNDSQDSFFRSSSEYEANKFTFPIYVGVDCKVGDETSWTEVAIDTNYRNVNQNLVESGYEPNPIIIPESNKAFFNVRQEKIGRDIEYKYQGYGINIFSRATSGTQKSIVSTILPANALMPPTGINSLLITDESPLMFTTANEQTRFGEITGNDKTLVRIIFDYYTVQELLNYTVPEGLTTGPATEQNSVFNPNTIYKDNDEVFADYFELYFRDSLPLVQSAKIISVTNEMNSIVSTIQIEGYTILTSGETIVLDINLTNIDRFEGGVLSIGDQNYIVTKAYIENGHVKVDVMNKEVATSILSENNATIDSEQIKPITIPDNKLCTLVENMQANKNWNQPAPMNSFKVNVPDNFKNIHREVVEPIDSTGKKELQIEKTRGIWNDVVIKEVNEKAYQRKADGQYELALEDQVVNGITYKKDDLIQIADKHLGLYSITFKDFKLPQHYQYDLDENGNSVEWFNGIIRLFTESAFVDGSSIPIKPRKEFKIVRTENIGKDEDLVLYISDPDFTIDNYLTQTRSTKDDVIFGVTQVDSVVSQSANYYPSYKVYLYADAANGLTKEKVLPKNGEKIHYSIFGIRTHGTNIVTALNPDDLVTYTSNISVPSTMYAVLDEKPKKPESLDHTTLYATRPDFFKRSTFTFTTKYGHKPHGVLHYRTNDEVLLSVLYKRTTINLIREELKKLGGNNEADSSLRWENFLNFETLEEEGNYQTFPVGDTGYHFPIPDNEDLIQAIKDFVDWHNESQKPVPSVPKLDSYTALNQIVIPKGDIEDDILFIYFIEQAIHAAFLPLTELPVIYEYINDSSYVPVNKKQAIKDKSGNILKPEEFDMAPMMKIVDPVENITQFTDFNLDGTSQNLYFYGVREMDIKMNFSPFGPFLGPVKLVPSNPPQTPEIKRIMPVLENPVLGIKPSIQIELNAYHPEQKIKKINIYRAISIIDAQSIRTMKPVKEVLISEETLSADFGNVWTIYDEFEDLENVPFEDGLFYRITVSREIEYPDPNFPDDSVMNIDYTPSQPSKITATVISDAVSPESPILLASGTATGTNGSVLKPVVFNWDKTVHNGKYLLYKMNNQGNWEKIHEIISNQNNIVLPLDDIDLYTDELIIKTDDGERIYYHFKVISVNSSGMYSSEEKILTL